MPQPSNVPSVALNTGADIPQLGFGVFQVDPGDATVDAVTTAIEVGYRSIDTAAAYRNEESVGQAIAAAGLPRDDLFVTTKLWNSAQGFEPALAAFDQSLERLGLEYVDLYLIHWPVPAADRYVDTWKALEQIHADGRARAIGVSNFHVPHLQRLLHETEIVPAVNQIELHPLLQQAELRAFHAEHGILTEAWSPLAQGGDLLDHPVFVALGEKHAKNAAQVILRWHVQLGNVVIPKSVTPARIASNLDVFDFALSDEDMAQIAALNTGERLGPNPDEFSAGA
jgi:diketogulonate reductase-like aldo/keto reductase